MMAELQGQDVPSAEKAGEMDDLDQAESGGKTTEDANVPTTGKSD